MTLDEKLSAAGLGLWSTECKRSGCRKLCWYWDGMVAHGENREAARPAVTGPELWAWLRQVHEYEEEA